MIDTKMSNSRKMGGVVALLASVLAITDSASAINLTLSQPTGSSTFNDSNIGQSFINDPSGTPGATIKLNDLGQPHTFLNKRGNIS